MRSLYFDRLLGRRKEKDMDDLDKAILNEIQSDFPITSRPYRELARRISAGEEDVISRVLRLKEEGVIRRIGGNFHSRSLDFTSTLCAAQVPPEHLDEFVQVVNRYPGVTHNYLRDSPYNVWFTFIAEDMEQIEASLAEISRVTGVAEILNLPARKMYKIKVDFEVE